MTVFSLSLEDCGWSRTLSQWAQMSQSLEGIVHVTKGGGHCHLTSKAALWVPVVEPGGLLMVPAPQTRP